jgi:hypothetical protein
VLERHTPEDLVHNHDEKVRGQSVTLQNANIGRETVVVDNAVETDAKAMLRVEPFEVSREPVWNTVAAKDGEERVAADGGERVREVSEHRVDRSRCGPCTRGKLVERSDVLDGGPVRAVRGLAGQEVLIDGIADPV